MKRSGYENVLVWALAGDPRLWLKHKIRFALRVSVRTGRESPRAPAAGELERGLKGKSRLQELG